MSTPEDAEPDPLAEQIARRRQLQGETGMTDPMSRVSETRPVDVPADEPEYPTGPVADPPADAEEPPHRKLRRVTPAGDGGTAAADEVTGDGTGQALPPLEPDQDEIEPEPERGNAGEAGEMTVVIQSGDTSKTYTKEEWDALTISTASRGSLFDSTPYRRQMGATVEGLEVIGVELSLSGTVGLAKSLAELVSERPFGREVTLTVRGTVKKREDRQHKDNEDWAIRKLTIEVTAVEAPEEPRA